jgi:hypothetical protein
MKYLKTYRLFEANWYDIIDHIKVLSEMSIDLWDKEFNVQVVDEIISRDHQCIVVNIVKKGSKKFIYTEIKDELLEMVGYMDREGWEILNMEFTHIAVGPLYCRLDGDKLVTILGEEIDYQFDQLIVKFVEKEVKTNESTEEDVHREMMIKKYGLEAIEECDEVLKNIEHMSFEVQDLDITVLFGYTPMTFLSLDTSPKIYVSIIADERLYAGKIADINIFKDTFLGYVRSLGFSTGQNTFTSDDRKIHNQILIQK